MFLSSVKNFIKQLETALAFAQISQDLTIKYGKKVFKDSFKLKKADYLNYNDSKHTGTLPEGWDYLLKDPVSKTKWYTKLKRWILDWIW